MGLNEKQKAAVEHLDGPLLVLAGPGTGKTQLLSSKVAYILENTDTNPENILCLTFTESGATNMRERLGSIMGGKDSSKVNISTYHAFGSEVLAQYKNYSDSYSRQLDSAIEDVTKFKIIKDIQAHLPGTDILRGDKIRDIIDTISSAKSARLTAEDLANIAKQNTEDSKAISEFASLYLKQIVPRDYKNSLEKAYLPILAELKKFENIPPILKGVERSIKLLINDLDKAVDEATAAEKITPLSSWKDAYFEKDERGNYRLKDRIANKKLASLANVMAKYEEYLKQHGLYDFDDMIEEAVRVLKEDEGFRLTLSERYQFILLDEFQDTNPSQFEIIKQLTDYEKPLIMAVGDDDQAIYEFQGASATTLINFQEHYHAEVIPLVENYRSSQEILDFSKHVIDQIDDNTRFGEKSLNAVNKNPATSQISRHEFLSSDAEYAFVAESIAKLIKSGVKQSDIAIIAPKHKYILPVLPYLKSQKLINISYEKRDNLLEDAEIHAIITIARFVHDIAAGKTPKTSILEILSYPFWGVSMLTVLKTFGDARITPSEALTKMSESEDTKLREIAGLLAELVAKAFDTPLNIFINYLIGAAGLADLRSPIIEYYVSRGEYQSYQLYENLALLLSKVERYVTEDRVIKLDDLVAMVDDYEAADLPISESSPYKDLEDAVQILSAHKAKGLEFKYVFLIAADHSAWGKGKGNNNLLSLPKNLLQIRHTGTTDGERLRLLYVAITRAKEHLVITNSRKDFNDKSPERLEYLGEFAQNTDNGEKIVSPYIPSQTVDCHYQEVDPFTLESNLRNWLTPYLAPSPDMRAIYKTKVENYRLSASSLTSFIDIAYAGPVEFFKQQILRAPREPATEQIIFGDLIHKTFEKVTNDGISDEQAIDFFLSELNKAAVEPETAAALRERGPKDLAISLAAFSDILRSGKAEVNLSPEKLAIEGISLTGKIDHITINDEAKTIEIYDFKTGTYHKEKWDSKPTLFKYMLQLGFYKLLLNLSPTYSKYHIAQAHILFVTPDKDGEVHDKVYEFNAEDEELLLKLIKSAHQHITSLDFLDDPELFIEADENRGIKDIKKFIELMLAKTAQK